jgi:hypothetical protein
MKKSILKKILAVSLVVSLSATAAAPDILASDTGYASEIKQDAKQDSGNGAASDDIPPGDPEDLSPTDAEYEKNNAQINFSEQKNLSGRTVDSIKSIAVTKNPDKIMYFSGREKIDLCGMELSVTYTNSDTTTISINEHTDKFEVKDLGGTVVASLVDSGDNSRDLLIEYQNAFCRITLDQPDWETEAIPMENEENQPTELTTAQPYRIYSFRPSETKTYHFFGFSDTSVDSYAELYTADATKPIDGSNSGGEKRNFLLSQELQAGTTYYFVVSHANWGTAGKFTCCLSSTISSLSELEVRKLEVTKASKNTWFDFETDPIPVNALDIKGTEYKTIYSNGWERPGTVEEGGYKTEIFGKTLSASWKYTTTDESGKRWADKGRNDNALIYTWGEQTTEFPVTFNSPSPVESISIEENPWEGWEPYQYQAEKFPKGRVSVKILYSDGTEETVTWYTEYGYNYDEEYNGYWIRVKLKNGGNIQPGAGNAIVIHYMGKNAEIPITIKENPVASIQILQKPEKTEYYPFEESADLYGMKVQIAYKNGKTQTAEATEHTDALTVPDTEGYGEELTSSLSDSKTVSVSYMGYTVEGAFGAKRNFTAEDSIQLTAEEEKQTVLSEGLTYQIFSFTPSEFAAYRFIWKGETWSIARIYNAANEKLADAYSWDGNLDYEMIGGRIYYIALINDSEYKQNITCSISRHADAHKKDVSEIALSMDEPSAGNALPDLTEIKSGQYYIISCSWLNDEKGDKIADFGKKHQFKAVLRAEVAYQFTASTEVTVNGKTVTEKSIGSDGDLTICYTFPSYTQFQITIPQAEGYTLDESQNAAPGRAGYGESYTFRYIKNTGTDSSKLIVKAGDTVLTPDGNGTYVIKNITQNITVTVKKAGDTPVTPPTTPADTPSKTPAPVVQPKASQKLKSKYDSKKKRLQVIAGSKLTQVITGAKTNVTFSSSNSKIAKVGKTTGVIRFVGAGKVVITAKAAETSKYKAASKKTTFYVIPRTASVKSLKSSKKGRVTIKGSNGAKDNTGYQIQYKHNGKTRKVSVKGKKSVTKTFKSLRSGKTFKVRMRAYKKVNGVTYYGKYGKWKTLKRVR